MQAHRHFSLTLIILLESSVTISNMHPLNAESITKPLETQNRSTCFWIIEYPRIYRSYEKKGAEKEYKRCRSLRARVCVSDRLAYINRHGGNWIKVPELFAGTLHTRVLAVEHLAIVPRYNAPLFGCNAQRKSFCLIEERNSHIDRMSRIRRLENVIRLQVFYVNVKLLCFEIA